MLTIDIPAGKFEVTGSWDGKSKKLITVPPIHLEMEHSLMSIAKWESTWKIPFTDNPKMTTEQFLDYCRCMTINRQKDPGVYRFLRQTDADKIIRYIDDPMSARVLRGKNDKRRGNPKRVMTAEYFYWLMIQYGIPVDVCEKWHFGRLLALIDCCQYNSGDQPKMTYGERQKYYAMLNDKRRKALGTRG